MQKDNSVQVGLEALGFKIASPAYNYVSALNDKSEADNVSMLYLLLKQYQVEKFAGDQAETVVARKP